VRPQLREEAEQDIEHQYGTDRPSVQPIAGGERDGRGADQQGCDHAPQLRQQNLPGWDRAAGSERIRAIPGEPPRGFGSGQPARIRSEELERLGRRNCVPARRYGDG
jgi:hypothetical protein